MKLQLALGLGLGAHRTVDRYGNMPAIFSIPAEYADTGVKRINFSEPVTVTMTGGVTLRIDGIPYLSGETIPVATSEYHTLTINNPGADAGTITFGKRKQITYLYLWNIAPSVITCEITGMKLTLLILSGLAPSVITGEIAGMKLTTLYLNNIGSSLTYGTNSLNITSAWGAALFGNTVFATAAEYERLIIDAASGTWNAATHPFVITAGTKDTDPGWGNVKAHVAVLLTKAAWTIIPSAWLTTGGGSWPLNWKEYTGE